MVRNHGLSSVKELVLKRAGDKRKITNTFKCLDIDQSVRAKLAVKTTVASLYQSIENMNVEINDLHIKACTGDELSDAYSAELDKQSDYSLEFNKKLSELTGGIAQSEQTKTQPISEVKCDIKMPVLNCPNFSGEGSSTMEYFSFITQFNNAVGLRGNVCDSTKLSYLKSYLRGYALKVIQHLSVTDKNYSVAVKLLEKEFLDKEVLADDLYKKLLEMKPKFDSSFQSTKSYINDVRCVLNDLLNYDRNLLEGETSTEFVSHIVFNSLPVVVQKEFIRKLNKNFPSVTDIFEHYVSIIRTLNLSSKTSVDKPIVKFTPKPNFVKEKPKSVMGSLHPSKTLLQNNASVSESKNKSQYEGKNCKFCADSSGHSMFGCRTYNSHESRVERCQELNLCSKCSSAKHDAISCTAKLKFRCRLCDADDHISALCAEFQPKRVSKNCPVNAGSRFAGTYLLPILTVLLLNRDRFIKLNCSIDSRSQKPYISQNVVKRIKFSALRSYKFLIQSLLNRSYLLSLRENSRDLYETNWKNQIQVGDIVLIEDPVKIRPYWDMGRVLEVIVGADDKIRSAKVIRKDRSEGTYPVKLLYPLELSLSEVGCPNPSLDHPTGEVSASRRPERKAAKKMQREAETVSN